MAGALKRAFGAIASAAALNSGLVIWCLPAPFNQVQCDHTVASLRKAQKLQANGEPNLNEHKDWSDNGQATPIPETADFLCRGEKEVREKIAELEKLGEPGGRAWPRPTRTRAFKHDRPAQGRRLARFCLSLKQ
jgi:hypothetical protein